MQNKILTTTNYSLFHNIAGNRRINQAQVKRLKDSIAQDPRLAIATPILVNDKMEILDGQHRKVAMEQLGLPISYFIVEDMGLNQVQTINSATRTWQPVDYARSFADLGKKDYQTYLDFLSKYHLTHSILLVYLTGFGRHQGTNTPVMFKQGKFKVGNIEAAHKLCERLADIGEWYPKYDTRSFALAFQAVASSKNYKHKRMVDKIKAFGTKLLKNTEFKEDYMRQLERIYNHHVREEDRLPLFER